jgi:nucleotide-binding universal stress UspA family protein
MKPTFLNNDVCRRFALPRRIAVATDLADFQVVLPYAISQARETGAHLCLIHALHPHLGGQMAGWLTLIDDRNDEIEAMDRLEDMQRAAHLRGVCCSIRLNRGEPKQVILNALRQINAGRLIVGSRGRRHQREVMHGSVAKDLMAAVRIPTLFIGPNVRPTADIQLRNILCLVSFEGEYEKVARFALLMGEVHQARVTLMHVLDGAGAINHARPAEWAHTALQAIIDKFGRREKMAAVDVRHGSLVDAACKAADELSSDVMVLGTCASHATRLKQLLAYQVMASVACPVYCYQAEPTEQSNEVDLDKFAACKR